MAGVQNLARPASSRGERVPGRKGDFVRLCGRNDSLPATHSRPSQGGCLAESDEWTDSWGLDLAEGCCPDIE